MSQGEHEKLLIARSVAIEAYASMESALCTLLARLLGTTNDTASIVFFRITNAHSRNTIIETLIQHSHGEKFDTYFHGTAGQPGVKRTPGLLSAVRQLDERRNQIVHWHRRDSGERTDLVPAYYWARDTEAEPIKADDLYAFAEKADFVMRSLMMFIHYTKPKWPFSDDEHRTWTQIFQRPGLYPPSSDHPLAPTPKAP